MGPDQTSEGPACKLSCFCCVQLFATLWTIAHQAPPSMGFSREESWSGSPCPPPGDLPRPGIEPSPLASSALAGIFFTTSATLEAPGCPSNPTWVHSCVRFLGLPEQCNINWGVVGAHQQEHIVSQSGGQSPRTRCLLQGWFLLWVMKKNLFRASPLAPGGDWPSLAFLGLQ